MEGTLQMIAINLATIAHMGTQVRAIGIQDSGIAIVPSPNHQFLIEIVQWFDFAGLELITVANGEPAKWNR